MYRLLFLSLFSALLYLSCGAQERFSAYASLGFVGSQVQGDNLAGFDKPGLAAGIGTRMKLSENWDACIELQYIQKGSQKLQNPDNNDYSYYKLKLNYAEVPLLLIYKIKKLGLFLGPVAGFLLKAKEETEAGAALNLYPFKTLDLSLAGGVGYKFAKRWSVNGRITESLLSIRETPAYQRGTFGRFSGQYNTAIIFFINFHF